MSEERRRGKSRRGEALLFLKQQQAQNSTGARDDSTAIQRLPRSPPSAKPLRACSIVASSDIIIIISIITCASSVFYRLQEKSRLATSSFVSTATATHSSPASRLPDQRFSPQYSITSQEPLQKAVRLLPLHLERSAPPVTAARCWATATIQAPPRASAQTPFALRLVIPPEISRLFTVIC